MSTISVKDQFGDCGFEIFEKARIPSIVRRYQKPTFMLTVMYLTNVRVVEVNVIRITYDVDLEVIHNLPMIAKTNYSLAIRSQRDSSNMKSALRVCFPKTILCHTVTKGLMTSKFPNTRKKPPHRFDPILPYWALNTHTRGLV